MAGLSAMGYANESKIDDIPRDHVAVTVPLQRPLIGIVTDKDKTGMDIDMDINPENIDEEDSDNDESLGKCLAPHIRHLRL